MRIISLLPGATEIVVALGQADNLVAVTHECDYPANAVKHLPRVTGSSIPIGTPGYVNEIVSETSARGESLFHLDADLIKQLKPDIILTQALCDVCAVSENDVRAIAAQMEIPPAIVTLSGTSLDGVFNDIRTAASSLDISEEGSVFVNSLTDRLEQVRSQVARAGKAPVRVAVIEWTDPIFAAGHWVPEMIQIAGGIDVLAQPEQHSVVVSMNDVIAAQPEVVFISPCGYDLERATQEAEELMSKPEWQWLKTVRVYPLDANGLVSRPGPRLVDGVEAMYNAIRSS